MSRNCSSLTNFSSHLFTSSEHCPEKQSIYSYTTSVAWSVTSILMALFGIANNSILLIVTLRVRSLKSGSGYLLANLFLTHFLMSAITLPTAAAGVLINLRDIQITDYYCNILQPINTILYVNLSWTEAGLAVNRYVAICRPRLYPAFRAKTTAYFTILLCWVISTGCTMPFVFGVCGSFRVIPRTNQCSVVYDGVRGQILGQSVVYGPFCVVGCAILLILRKVAELRLQIGDIHTSRNGPTNAGLRQIRRGLVLGRVLLAGFIGNLLCIVPISLVIMIFPLALGRLPVMVLVLRSVLAAVYVFIPLVFYAMNEDYRHSSRNLMLSMIGCHANVAADRPVNSIPLQLLS
ncbi:hypothetical protein BV898_08963 [Hypsibius exemplaris]|uniref:G-protein coupled receptors family 1 profile domain-containing protein n=1 Tax=Hypsibius exemplaris TaxID=2072580 RepID=A0A1W0WP29_HYPEX|nr:hypothetical protein BV898_08963 [Hypsibius exemplaris]